MASKFGNTIIQNKPLLLAAFIALALFLRFFSFFPSVLDHDESTYLIIGRDLANGKALYTDVTDTKPVGIFMIYAAFHYLFGYSIFWVRFSAAIIVGLTAFLINRLSLSFFNNSKAALAGGVIYIFYTSMWAYHGLSPNAELYFNLCTVAAFLLFQQKTPWKFALAGLTMGIGFMIKYLVLFDFAAIMLFMFIGEIARKELNLKSFMNYVYAGLGMLLPFVATNLYFWLNGHYDSFYFITYEMPGLYKSAASIPRYFKMLGDLMGRFLPITFFFFYAWFSKQIMLGKDRKRFFLVWMAAVLAAMYLPGKEFSHYTIQLMLPVSLVAGLFFHSELKLDSISTKIFRGKVSVALLGVLIVAVQAAGYASSIAKPDQYEEVADYLKPQLSENDFVFVSNYEQIIYYLLQMDSPTKFVHSNMLFEEKLSKAFRVDAYAEVNRILERKPKFVLIQRTNEMLEPLIMNTYKPDTTFRNGEVKVFKRIE